MDIPLSTETRYLRMQIDSKLIWNPHFDIVTKKAKQYLCLMVNKLSKHWGPKPHLVKWVYNAIVKPRITYGALVWAQSIKTIGKKQKLAQITRLAALMLTPTHKKAPTAALEIIHDIMPLELSLQETAVNTFRRLKLTDNTAWVNKTRKNKSITPHLGFLKELLAKATSLNTDTESTCTDIEDKGYWITIDNHKGKHNPIPAQLNIYTDGSRTKQGAGAGFIVMRGKSEILYSQSINLTNDASIFQAELIAIQEAANFLTLSGLGDNEYIKFFSDSDKQLYRP